MYDKYKRLHVLINSRVIANVHAYSIYKIYTPLSIRLRETDVHSSLSIVAVSDSTLYPARDWMDYPTKFRTKRRYSSPLSGRQLNRREISRAFQCRNLSQPFWRINLDVYIYIYLFANVDELVADIHPVTFDSTRKRFYGRVLRRNGCTRNQEAAAVQFEFHVYKSFYSVESLLKGCYRPDAMRWRLTEFDGVWAPKLSILGTRWYVQPLWNTNIKVRSIPGTSVTRGGT